MKTRQRLVAGVLGALCAASATLAQVPNTLYMQGNFLNSAGGADPGVHSFQYVIASNGTVVLIQNTPTQVTANASGLANFTITDTNLPVIFQTATNTLFNMEGGRDQAFVTTPYTFQAGNLSMASGNFTVMGDLNVASNASMLALTATNGATLHAPVTIAKFANFTNLDNVVFDGSLTVAGGVVMDSAVEANYATVFSSGSATSRFCDATNNVVLSNATIRQSFNCITTNLPTVGTSGTAVEDGFLIVWIKVKEENTTSGVYVNIGGLQFKLQDYVSAVQAAPKLYIYTGSTFPVAQGTSWSTSLVNAGDSSDITIQCYWIPLHGDG